jgi:hypothetical protein
LGEARRGGVTERVLTGRGNKSPTFTPTGQGENPSPFSIILLLKAIEFIFSMCYDDVTNHTNGGITNVYCL